MLALQISTCIEVKTAELCLFLWPDLLKRKLLLINRCPGYLVFLMETQGEGEGIDGPEGFIGRERSFN